MADEVPLAPHVRPTGEDEPTLLEIETRPAGQVTLVVVSGAIDIVTEQTLQTGLSQALARSDRGIDLDMSGVDFCDCSGLNVLLRLRRRALDEGKVITVRTASTAVLRLLSVTGTLPLFALTDETETPGIETPGMEETDVNGPAPDVSAAAALALGAEITSLDEANQELRTEVGQLRRAMQTRPVIDLARGVLMASFGLNAEESWTVLVSVSQNTNTKLHEVADNLVKAVTGDDLPELFRLQISETITRLRAAAEGS